MLSTKRSTRKIPSISKKSNNLTSAFGGGTRRRSSTSSMGGSINSLNNSELWIGLGITLLLVLLFIGACYYNKDPECSDGFESVKTGFHNLTEGFRNKLKGGGGLKELDIIYFMSPTCPWCQKMNKVLEDSGDIKSVTVVDVTTPQGQEMAKGMGAADKGIPAFISKKNKTGTVGFKQSVKELKDSLNKKGGPSQQTPQEMPQQPKMNPNEAVSKVQDLQVVLFASPNCGWCNKLKTELGEAGVIDMVEVIDVSNPDGQQKAKEMLGEFRGVPIMKSKATGKSVTGYKPLPDIIAGLS